MPIANGPGRSNIMDAERIGLPARPRRGAAS